MEEMSKTKHKSASRRKAVLTEGAPRGKSVTRQFDNGKTRITAR